MRYLTVEEILFAHHRIIQISGGAHGVRDVGLLFSIAHKPQTAFAGEELYPNIFQKAAVLLEAITAYHVFIDGNKRTAFTCTEAFLRINGWQLSITIDQGYRFVLRVATKKTGVREAATWLKRHAKPM